jgi:hypothetical protein
MARYITLAERLANNPILNPHKINEEQVQLGDDTWAYQDKDGRFWKYPKGIKTEFDKSGKLLGSSNDDNNLSADEKFEKRQKERDDYWEKKIKNNPEKRRYFKQQKDVVNKLFNGKENYEHNENELKNYFDNNDSEALNKLKKKLELKNVDDLVNHIEQGGFSTKGEFKRDLQKKYKDCEHIHITETGTEDSSSDSVIIYFKDGKIHRIGTHKELGIKVEGR